MPGSALYPELFSGNVEKSAAEAAHVLIPVEVDGSANGKCQFVADSFNISQYSLFQTSFLVNKLLLIDFCCRYLYFYILK